MVKKKLHLFENQSSEKRIEKYEDSIHLSIWTTPTNGSMSPANMK